MLHYRRNDIELCFGKIQERKKPVIELRIENKGYVIGQLRTIEDVNVFCKALNYIMEGSERYRDDIRDIVSGWED